MRIPFTDIKRQYQSIKKEVLEITEQVFEETSFSGGKQVKQFEQDFANFCESNFSMSCNSGTSALHLALLALGIKEGDEVILPANTFIATAWAISYVKAKPIFVDCKSDTWQIDCSKIEEKINSNTKAIIGVHLYGQPFDVDSVKAICNKHQLVLIEDAAQAHGAKYKDQVVGTFGEMSCFSFYPSKNLGAFGEGGAVVSQQKKYYDCIQRLKNQGTEVKYHHDDLGYNYRMDTLQSAILSLKLTHLTKWNSKRKSIAKRYQKEIINEKLKFQKQPDWSDSVYHLFVLITSDRNALIEFLKQNGIDAGMHYPIPCHLQKAYSFLEHKIGDFPETEKLAMQCVSLPMFPELTHEEVDHIIKTINNY